MANPEQVEGRCNARTRAREGSPAGYCGSWPVKGGKRCRMHGGHSPNALPAEQRKRGGSGKPPGRPIVHGRYSDRFKRTSKTMAAEIEASLADPALLDLRRPLAVAMAMLHEWTVMPSQEDLTKMAQTEEMAAMDIQPPAIDVLLAGLKFQRAAREIVVDVHNMQKNVVREVGIKEVLTQAVPALLARLFERMRTVVENGVTDPELRERLTNRMADEARMVIVETFQLSEKAKAG